VWAVSSLLMMNERVRDLLPGCLSINTQRGRSSLFLLGPDMRHAFWKSVDLFGDPDPGQEKKIE
jgi:hypothetical protein